MQPISQEKLQEWYEKGKQRKFTLPSEVTFDTCSADDGTHVYIFYHDKIGEIGRIVVLARNDKTEIRYEIQISEGEAMTEAKMKLFAPIAKQISDTIDRNFKWTV